MAYGVDANGLRKISCFLMYHTGRSGCMRLPVVVRFFRWPDRRRRHGRTIRFTHISADSTANDHTYNRSYH